MDKAKACTIGYLVPEFPGQTHNFFWKEREILETIDIRTKLISTRRPRDALISHSWARAAQGVTVYLAEIDAKELFKAFRMLVHLGPAAWIRAFGACLSGCPPTQIMHNLGLILVAAKLVSIMRRNALSHIHSHSCGNAALIVMLANRLSGIHYSLTLHGDLKDYGAQQNVKFRYAEFAIAITDRLRHQIRDTLKEDAPRRIGLAPMGVDTELFKRECPYAPWNGAEPLHLFSCGRLNFVKGHQDLIRAVKLLRDEGVDAFLQIAGEDDAGGDGYRKDLEALISELHLEEAVLLLGAVPVSRVLAGLASSHLFVLASHHEPLGVAIMEAMSYGTPVVATNRGGVPELVDHLVDGFLVSPKSPRILADSIRVVVSNKAMVTRFSEAGRQKIIVRFQSNLSAKELKQMLSSQANATAVGNF